MTADMTPSGIVATLRRDLAAQPARIAYAERVAAMNGEHAALYAEAARILRQQQPPHVPDSPARRYCLWCGCRVDPVLSILADYCGETCRRLHMHHTTTNEAPQ